jgi:broad specificity phosphatase PhoE
VIVAGFARAHNRRMLKRYLTLTFVTLVAGLSTPAIADDALWALLQKGGQVVLISSRPDHARGRRSARLQARRLQHAAQSRRRRSPRGRAPGPGAARASRPVARVVSSPWCRCIETARLAFGSEPAIDDALSNLFDHSQNRERQVAAFRKLVASAPKTGNLILVTHGSTTSAFTGINQGTAEMVIVTRKAASAIASQPHRDPRINRVRVDLISRVGVD